MPNYYYSETRDDYDSPWRGNSRIKKVVIENGVKNIGSLAFEDCSNLTSITIPISVTSIGNQAFSGCSGLESIIVEKGNTKYDSRDNCNAIIETKNNTLIVGCKNTVIPKSVTGIASYAFYGCSGLISVTIPDGVYRINQSTFAGCSRLTSITIPNSVKEIGKYAFNACRSLTSIIIPDGVTYIPFGAFWGCSSLSTIILPKSLKEIDECAFVSCRGLNSLICEAITPPRCWGEIDVSYSIPVYVPANSVEAYKQRQNGWCYHLTNIHAITEIPSYTVTLEHNDGGSNPEQISVTFGKPMPENIGLVVPTKTGYEFTGYSSNGIYYYDANMKSVRNYDQRQNLTLYANWKIPTTNVSLDFQGGQNGTTLVTATYGKAMPTGENIVAPTRAGFTFGGYYSSPNGMGTQYYNADMLSKSFWYQEVKDTKLYAKWIPKVYVTTIGLSDVKATLWVGETKSITTTVGPTTASNKTLTWSSSNTSVATVSSTGVITAKNKGTATITCKASDGSGISKSCAVTVKQQINTISLSATEATLWVGKTKYIKATVNPTTASKTTVNWSSSDTNVATVSKYGTITAIGKGNCTITCEAADGYGAKAECEVTVKQQVTSIDFGYKTLSVTCGTTKTLTPKIYPSNASVQTLTWKSKNTSVATVTSAGVLKAIAPGTAQIICTATDGFKKADTITVEVVPLKITDSKPTIAEGTYGIGGIVYTRTLTEGKYAAFCLPYNVNLNDYTDEFAKVYVPMGMAFLKPNGTLMVMFKKVSLTETIKAGKPFVALAAKSGAVAITNDYKKTFTTLTNPEPASLDVYNWSGSNGFLDFNPDITAKIGGNYGKLTGLDSEKYYLVSTSGAMSKAASVSPYRIYVYKDDKNSNAKVTEIIFSFDEDEMATGIENITNEQKDDDKIYNINGQRINKANAQKGIYIKNGKKYANKN